MRSGFEDRRLKLDEFHAAQFTEVLRAVLGRLELNAEQRALVPVVVPDELRRLSARAHNVQD